MSMGTDPVIDLDGLRKDYDGVAALRNIDLRVEAGGIVGLLGPNGAGKTTLVETLEGLRRPTAGRVSVLGLDPFRDARRLRERLGAQLQAAALPQELTPLETLRLFGGLYRTARPPGEILEEIGLAAEATKGNRALSGGQQRRLAIAMALVNDPELLILDEPTSGLDPAVRREMHALFLRLRAADRTVILTTHYIEEAETLCDRVVVLRSGEIVADGTPFELTARAGGASTIWIAVEGTLDVAPLLAAGATARGMEAGYFRFSTTDPTAAILALGDILKLGQTTVKDIRMKRPGLEDVYLELTEKGAATPREEGEA